MFECYTNDSCLDGKSRKRQSAIDIVRMVRQLAGLGNELSAINADENTDVANVINEFVATLPKADREELLHG